MLTLSLAAAALAFGPAEDPAPLVYTGFEAQALYCAATITMSAHVLHGTDQISRAFYNDAAAAAARILAVHVSGSEAERIAGYDQAMQMLYSDGIPESMDMTAALRDIEACKAVYLDQL